MKHYRRMRQAKSGNLAFCVVFFFPPRLPILHAQGILAEYKVAKPRVVEHKTGSAT